MRWAAIGPPARSPATAPTSAWSVERANSSRSVVYALRVLLLRLARKRSRRPRARAIPSESPCPAFKTHIPLRHSLGSDGGLWAGLTGPRRSPCRLSGFQLSGQPHPDATGLTCRLLTWRPASGVSRPRAWGPRDAGESLVVHHWREAHH